MLQEFGKSIARVLPDFMDGRPATEAWRPCFELIAAGVSTVCINSSALQLMKNLLQTFQNVRL